MALRKIRLLSVLGLILFILIINFYSNSLKDFGKKNPGEFTINVFKRSDNIIPIITQPEDIVYNYSTTGNSITWVISDLDVNGTNCIIQKNNIVQASFSWISGQDITYPIDDLIPGMYNFSIYATDGLGGSCQDDVLVEVKNPPTVNVMMVFILFFAIAGVLGITMIATRPKKVKEDIVMGKKKTCRQCGKYVKPYAYTCPYCGYKLAEEETMADAMNKLSHLFIFHEESGVCLYYHPFTDAKIDPQLISGFLSAITSFGGQFEDATTKKKDTAGVTVKKSSSDLKELVYKEYHILMETTIRRSDASSRFQQARLYTVRGSSLLYLGRHPILPR